LGAIPSVVAEVGPGNSLGIGLAALLSGARAYHAFDVINFVNPLRDIEIVERIAELFARRAPISKGGEFENVRPPLATHDFPGEILSRDHLERALQLRRSAIREAILRHAGLCTQPNDAIVLRYSTDWGSHDSTLRREAKVDLVLSQAVMQYVDDLDAAYRAHFRWLRPGGMVSHQIDFSAHETGWDWNAHWTISDLQWRIIRGGKTFFCNRQPYSAHLDSMRRAGFEVVGTVRVINHGGLPRRHLTARYQGLNDEDLSVQSALIQARKPFTALF
jgi:hypothetical protein